MRRQKPTPPAVRPPKRPQVEQGGRAVEHLEPLLETERMLTVSTMFSRRGAPSLGVARSRLATSLQHLRDDAATLRCFGPRVRATRTLFFAIGAIGLAL